MKINWKAGFAYCMVHSSSHLLVEFGFQQEKLNLFTA